MKNHINLFRVAAIVAITLISIDVYGQKDFSNNVVDTTVSLNDSVVLRLGDYVGEHVHWQSSNDGLNWTDISGASADTLLFIADKTTYFRASVIAGSCDPFHSDMVLVVVYQLATVVTSPVSDITYFSATSGGEVTDDGGASVTSRGVVWSTSQNPTIEDNDGITMDGTGVGEFTSNLTGLDPGVNYYVRAYATNIAGTAYGEDVRFETTVSTYSLVLGANPSEAGSVEGAGEYQEGEQINIAATPNEGYEFVNWTGDTEYLEDANAANTIVTMPADDITLTANFEEEDAEWPRDTETEVVDVYNPATGKTWMDRNLGASRVATSSDDEQAYGDLYQWGRAADGHQKRTSDTTSTLSSSDTPGHGNFILAPNWPYDWRSPHNKNLWQGVNGVNNPCPSGYRLPTAAEWDAELMSWSTNNAAGAFASPLKLPVAGYRHHSDGSLHVLGSFGYYWSSNAWWSLVHADGSRRLRFFSINADIDLSKRAYGYSVRCIKD